MFPSRTAERILRDHAADLSLGQFLLRGDALLGQKLDIFLLTGRDRIAGGYDVIPGHVDHGVALDQIGGVLGGMK